ncbi:MAG: hypothetical protein NVV60_11935 [Luteimonas sp.]|nr:hypothetical protein [Luteimonas sp.]MCR6663821.1 hypothetical protein [Luteimonas sp.]
MSTLISSIFLLSLVAMVLVYPMYFISLSAFGKIMVRDHSDLVGQKCLSLRDSYKFLQLVKTGRLGDRQISPDAARAHSSAKRLLYIGMSLFMVVLLIVLADSVVSKSGMQA